MSLLERYLLFDLISLSQKDSNNDHIMIYNISIQSYLSAFITFVHYNYYSDPKKDTLGVLKNLRIESAQILANISVFGMIISSLLFNIIYPISSTPVLSSPIAD